MGGKQAVERCSIADVALGKRRALATEGGETVDDIGGCCSGCRE